MKKIALLIIIWCLCATYAPAAEMDIMIRDAVYSGWHTNVEKHGSKYGVKTFASDSYAISDMDETVSAPTKYYGFLSADGKWYIMRVSTTVSTDDTFRYTHGNSGYSTAWTNRAGATVYNYYDVEMQ